MARFFATKIQGYEFMSSILRLPSVCLTCKGKDNDFLLRLWSWNWLDLGLNEKLWIENR
jgi:hypothetical protein